MACGGRLLCRFYDVGPGQLFIDGIDVMQLKPEALRQRLGIVLQEPHIFPGSIHDNIALGRSGVGRTEAETATRQAQAFDFIQSLPQAFDTVLAGHGRGLSHGQKQLIALARVLAAQPDILVFDEATAHIDRDTEQALQHATAAAMRGRTMLVIAHRLNTIRHFDRIVVMQSGQIVQQGSHEALMASGGLYRDLVAAEAIQMCPSSC